MPNLVELSLRDICISPEVQSRASISQDAIDRYAEGYVNKDDIPPPRVFQDGPRYWLSRGHHRVPAALQAGLQRLTVEVLVGDKRAAILDAMDDNHTNGLHLTREDKRHAVITLLNDPIWQTWNQSEIARHAHVSSSFVGMVLKERGGQIPTPKRVRTKDGREYMRKPQTDRQIKTRSRMEFNVAVLNRTTARLEQAAALIQQLRGVEQSGILKGINLSMRAIVRTKESFS